MAATIRDIKNRTGLSLATISKYLNGGNVLPENQEKIEEAIKALHYEVNEIARGLVTNRTRTVGVIVFDIESLFNASLLHHIGDELRQHGYGMLICDSGNNPEQEQANMRFLLSKKVDGIILIPISRSGEVLEPAKKSNVPVILLDRTIENSGCDCVHIDNYRAIRSALRYLYERSHREIAIIGSGAVQTGEERLNGFYRAAGELNLRIPECWVKKGTHSLEYGYQAFQELMELPHSPTAVVLSNYEITLGAIMALNKRGINCPEDISLFGFDDLLVEHVVRPQINRVVQPMMEMGKLAAELILERIQTGNSRMPRDYILDTSLLEGNSVRAL